jgi:CheY-like chemotaxis protein
VVLIDDDAPIVAAASFILGKVGCIVVAAASGPQALQALATSTRVPDAIVCDYELDDDCKGTDVIRDLREEFNRDIPALLVTGDTSGAAEASARDMSLPVLYKPLDAAALRDSLESLLCNDLQ